MRLTLDLLQQVPQSLNAAKQRQLHLRGCKIPAIENLGATLDAYECLDFSDNDLIKVANFPPLKRLHTLIFTNNRISRIAEDALTSLPNVESIVLTGNKLEKLIDLEPLTTVKNLERLSLLDNPVTKVKHYRPYMIAKCSKSLRILDFQRIKDKERKAASLLFGGDRGKRLMEEIAPPRSAGKDVTTEKAMEQRKAGPSADVIERIKNAIAEAKTMEEVTRLDEALKTGVLPDELKLTGEAAVEEKKEDAEAMAAAAPKASGAPPAPVSAAADKAVAAAAAAAVVAAPAAKVAPGPPPAAKAAAKAAAAGGADGMEVDG